MDKLCYSFVQSSSCTVGIVWIRKGKSVKIVRIVLSKSINDTRKASKRFFPDAEQKKDRTVTFIVKKIKDYLEGKITHFNIKYLNNSLCPKFRWAVCRQVRKIPYGRVITYKGLAELVGIKSARAIGNALAKNPFPIIIPCHRIVGSNRKIGGFQSGKDLKKALLKLEGIMFDRKGSIPKEFFVLV